MSPRTRSGFVYGRKPNGKMAKSANEYVRAWRIHGALAAACMTRAHKGSEWICYAFDPGIQLHGKPGGPSEYEDIISLSPRVATALASAMRELLTPSEMRRLLRRVPK